MPHEYGDVVQVTRKGVKVNFNVVRAEVVKVQRHKPTPTDPGIREEEHLSGFYLDPTHKEHAHTGIGMDRCWVREYGVKLDPEPEPPAAPAELPAPPSENPVTEPTAADAVPSESTAA